MKLNLGWGTLALAALAAMLGGCRSDSASYMIKGPELSLTLIVDQAYLWDEQWQLGLLTTRQPECMRRHSLQPAPIAGLKLDVYQAGEGAYIVKEGANWYVADTQKCRLQQYKTPPAEPGEMRGSFEFREGKLVFVALPKPVEQPPAAAPVTPAPIVPVAPAAAEALAPAAPLAAPASAPVPAPAGR